MAIAGWAFGGLVIFAVVKAIVGKVFDWAFTGLAIFAVVILLRVVSRYWDRIW